MQRSIGNARTQAAVQRATRTKKPQAQTFSAERSPFALTGTYSFESGKTRGTLTINHAGRGLTGTLQVRQMGKDPSNPRKDYYSIKTYRVSGLRDDAAMTKDNQSFEATLDGEHRSLLDFNLEDNGKVTLGFEGTDETLNNAEMKRISKRPTLQINAGAIKGRNKDAFLAQMNMPLDGFQKKQIRKLCDEVKTHVDNYFSYWSHAARTAQATQINAKISAFVAQYPKAQRPLIAREMKHILTTARRQKRHYLDWLSLMVNREAGYTSRLQQTLGIGPDSGMKHKYAFSFEVGGASGDLIVGGQVMLGAMHIEKKAPDTWKQSYAFGFVGFSLGASVGATVAMDGSGTMESAQPWAPDNFQGPVGFGGPQGQLAIWGGQASSLAGIVFQGNGTFRAIVGDASGHANVLGVTAGVEAGASMGYLKRVGGDVTTGLREIYKPPTAKRTEVAKSAERTVHFKVNSAELSAKGKSSLRKMATENVGLFNDPNSKLQIDGYASRSGSDAHNQKLSEARAQTVHNFLKSVLTTQYRIKKGNLKITGHGEQAAAKAGDKDRKENKAWRKTVVKLNGTTVLVLK